jgi:hypothetical protein
MRPARIGTAATFVEARTVSLNLDIASETRRMPSLAAPPLWCVAQRQHVCRLARVERVLWTPQ